MINSEAHDCVELLKGLGELYRRGGQPQRALVLLLIAIWIVPNDVVLLRNLAMAFTDSGDIERALDALDCLAEHEGESSDLLLLRSRALWLGARKEEARQCFKRYLANRRVGV